MLRLFCVGWLAANAALIVRKQRQPGTDRTGGEGSSEAPQQHGRSQRFLRQ